MRRRFALCILGLAFASAPVLAGPTLYGPSGLIEMPTAESLRYKEFNVAADYVMDPLYPTANSLYYKANLGTFKGWEMGVVGGRVPTEGVFLNLKYYLMSDETRYPVSIAIGLERLASIQNSSIYLVASKLFQDGLSLHFGFRATMVNQELDATVMGGAAYYVTNALGLMADVVGQRRTYRVNAGVQYAITEWLTIRGAVYDAFSANTAGPQYSAGFAVSKFL
jgi:hypothetical protein